MGDKIVVNVGGRRFHTSATTIANAGPNSMLRAMLSDDWTPKRKTIMRKNADQDMDDGGEEVADEIFIDRNPEYFGVLLDLLRTGELEMPAGMSERALYRESLYYGVVDRVREACWGRPMDGNRMNLAATVMGRATGDATAIRGSQDGGCCVAHGCMVHAYDWTLQQSGPPLTLDFQAVNDAGFVEPHRLLICTCERVDRGGGGMALFDTVTGSAMERFRVTHSGEPKNFTAGALACAETTAYASCRGRSNEYGIAVWDLNAGSTQSDFLYDCDYPTGGYPLGDARKLQWLPQNRVLLVATLYPVWDDSFIGLVDFRERNVVWSWSDSGVSRRNMGDDKVVLDCVAMESCNTICVVNQYDNLGFIDIRSSTSSVRWSHRNRPGKTSEGEERCYSKLSAHGDQLFSTKGDSVYVFCSPDWVVTSRLRKSHAGSISDISVGGDRLFVLHNEDDVFDVWQTPKPSALGQNYLL